MNEKIGDTGWVWNNDREEACFMSGKDIMSSCSADDGSVSMWGPFRDAEREAPVEVVEFVIKKWRKSNA